MRYRLLVVPGAERALRERLRPAVAVAAMELMVGDLLENPRRIGSPLSAPFTGHFSARRGTYRIRYEIDDAEWTVTVLQVSHRRDAYR